MIPPSDIPLVCLGRGGRTVRFIWGLIVAVCLLYVAPLHDVRAQPTAKRIQPLSPAAEARSGIYLLQNGHPAQALPFLKRSYSSRPTLRLSTYGALAYWVGEAYHRSGDTSRARKTWYRGYHRLDESGAFDVRLADAYLRTLGRKTLLEERGDAVEAYTRLWEALGTTPDSSLRPVFRRRVAQIAPLLPDDVFTQVVDGTRSADPSSWTFHADAGGVLRTWWENLDPFPATSENERVEEHVTRLVHARRAFSCPENTSTFDARGTVYLRFGAPFRRHELRYKDGEFFREVFRFGVHVSQSAFPDSEVWTYPQIDDSGVYLFAEAEGSDCFELATTNDLLPKKFTTPRGDSQRSLNIAYSALVAMRSIFEELALQHDLFSARYSDIANYSDRQEMKAALANASQALTGEYAPRSPGEQAVRVGAGVGQTRVVFSNPSTGLEFPSRFVSRMVARSVQADASARKRRKKNMPRQYTALHGGTPQLPVAVRTARFLTPEGSTRTEVYWGVRISDAQLTPEEDDEPPPSMIRFSAVHQNADRSRSKREYRWHQLPSTSTALGPTFVAPAVAFQSTSSHHLRLQWTQYRLISHTDGSTPQLGPKRRFALVKADSMRPLRAKGTRLEMSDLKVLSATDSAVASGSNPAEAARPYPFRYLHPDHPLALSFEIYHLSVGSDDRTRYTVNYEVKGATRRGWTKLFRGQDEQRTSTSMTQTGTSRRSEEMIILDLSQIKSDESQDLRVTVTVTDEQTDASVTRSLDFVMAADEQSE